MNIKHWGPRLRSVFAVVVCLPVVAFAVVAWMGSDLVRDVIDVARSMAQELPADKASQVTNVLSRLNERARWILFSSSTISATLLILAFLSFLFPLFKKLMKRSERVFRSQHQIGSVNDLMVQMTEKIEHGSQQNLMAIEQSAAQLEIISSAMSTFSSDIKTADKTVRIGLDEFEKSHNEIKQVNDSLGDLVKQGKKLEEITSVLESIAFQTNILAVNAAVEAARAGEQGRGFAIVAEAVRNLAQTSAVSAKNISQLIRENGENSKRAIEMMRSGAEGLSVSLGHIRRSQQSIGALVGFNGELTESLAKMGRTFHQLESSSKFIAGTAEDSQKLRSDFLNRFQDIEDNSKALTSLLFHDDAWQSGFEMTEADSMPSIDDQSFKDSIAQMVKVDSHSVESPADRLPKHPNISSFPAKLNQSSKRTVSKSKTAEKPAHRPQAPSNLRARDVIPFEGESESEVSGDAKIGNISGF